MLWITERSPQSVIASSNGAQGAENLSAANHQKFLRQVSFIFSLKVPIENGFALVLSNSCFLRKSLSTNNKSELYRIPASALYCIKVSYLSFLFLWSSSLGMLSFNILLTSALWAGPAALWTHITKLVTTASTLRNQICLRLRWRVLWYVFGLPS